jgi:signal transduction histidine kinase
MTLDNSISIEHMQTNQAQIEPQLGANEKYQLVFSNMNEGFILGKFTHGKIHPNEFKIVETNDAFLKLMTIQRENLIGKTATELLAEFKTERPFWLSVFSNVPNMERPIRLEYHSKRIDKWYHISISNIVDDYIAATFEDITDRKKSELELKTNETKYRLLFSNMNEGFILGRFLDSQNPSPDNFQVLEVNDFVSRQADMPIKDIVNKTASQIISELHLDMSFWNSLFSTIKESNKPIRKEYYYPNLDRWYIVSVFRPMQNHLAAVFENITDQKKAEEKIRLLFSNMNEGFLLGRFIYTEGQPQPSDFQIIEINDMLLKQFRLTKETILNKTVLQIISDFRSERPFWFSLFAQIQTNQPPLRFEYYFKRYNRWYNISFYSPMKDHLAVIMDDITDRKRAEEQLRWQNEDLAHRSKEISEANKELESFSYSISHDLRAPIRTIDGFSQALLEDYIKVLDDQGQNYLRRLHEGAQQMNKMIDAILRLSRETRRELHCEPVDLTAVTENIVTKLNEEFPDYHVNTTIGDIQVYGDKELLTTVLTNLLRNAWKFTKNTPNPQVEIGTTSKNGETIHFVKDNGAGFDMKYADKLFVLFQRLHNAQEYPGIGIGLSIVKHIINKHGGHVWAEGSPGKGATFYFTIPACPREQRRNSEPTPNRTRDF